MATLQRILSRLRMTGDPAPRIAASELVGALERLAGADRILQYLGVALRETFRASSVAVSLLEPITGRFVERDTGSNDGHPAPSLDFSPSDRLISWLCVNQLPAVFSGPQDLRGFLASGEQERLSERGIILAVPMFAAGRLEGMILLGPRTGGSPYGTLDQRDLSAIARQAALSLEYSTAHDTSDTALKKLFMADKLATVGELAAGAAHEIRNPLTLIRGVVELASTEVQPERRPLYEAALHEVDRIDAILKGLLSLSRTSRLEMTRLSLAELVGQSMVLLNTELKRRNITARLELGRPADTEILGDRPQLQQAFLNILWNALQAMPGGGELTVSVSEGRLSGPSVPGKPALAIRVADTGEGIPPDLRSGVFDPFFTTKEEGTGLGLSIAYGIVARHGGEIGLESCTEPPRQGTTVTVILPRHDE